MAVDSRGVTEGNPRASVIIYTRAASSGDRGKKSVAAARGYECGMHFSVGSLRSRHGYQL